MYIPELAVFFFLLGQGYKLPMTSIHPFETGDIL